MDIQEARNAAFMQLRAQEKESSTRKVPTAYGLKAHTIVTKTSTSYEHSEAAHEVSLYLGGAHGIFHNFIERAKEFDYFTHYENLDPENEEHMKIARHIDGINGRGIHPLVYDKLKAMQSPMDKKVEDAKAANAKRT